MSGHYGTSPCSPRAPNLLHVLPSRMVGWHKLCNPDSVNHVNRVNGVSSAKRCYLHLLQIVIIFFWSFEWLWSFYSRPCFAAGFTLRRSSQPSLLHSWGLLLHNVKIYSVIQWREKKLCHHFLFFHPTETAIRKILSTFRFQSCKSYFWWFSCYTFHIQLEFWKRQGVGVGGISVSRLS